jgi:hypothetical protein
MRTFCLCVVLGLALGLVICWGIEAEVKRAVKLATPQAAERNIP